jgi:DNA-directed RNA polymerase specialized sigma24 family protein
MPPPVPEELSRAIETLYRSESGRVLATLVRLLGDLDLAEDAMHEAFAAALESWPQTGIPDEPRPWLISTARFKAINGIRWRARFERNPERPASSAKSLRAQPDGKVLITDGPYLETKEHLGGFWVLEAADLNEALAWGRKAAVACRTPVEVRPFWPMEGPSK